MIDLTTAATAAGQAIAVIAALGGLALRLHGLRTAGSAKIEARITGLDADIDGLTKQLGQIRVDMAERYVTRADHAGAITTLNDSVLQLNGTVQGLSNQLFELARDRGARS